LDRFRHLILTPFNIRTAGAPGLDEGWLAHRFELFETFCYPAIRAQTCRDFRWLVFLDPDTPAGFQRRIEDLGSDSPLEPVYIPKMEDYRRPTLERIGADVTHVITTTLDNDDAVATSFVERVQAEFRGQDFEFVNFLHGYRLDLRKRRLYAHAIRVNPFISLIERNGEGVRTMRGCGPHDHLASKFPQIRDVATEPLWLQVVHGRNIAVTGVWGCRRVPLSVLQDRFALTGGIAAVREAALPMRIENVRRRLERALIRLLGSRGDAAARKALRAVRRLRAR
jgi:hypothetical protein